MGDLSKHFSRHEIACKCGCGFDVMDAETIMLAEIVREYVGGPVVPNSGARCYAHNKKCKGAKSSQHLLGRAMDLVVADPVDVGLYLHRKFPNKYGIGIYPHFVHVDSRGGPAARFGSLANRFD